MPDWITHILITWTLCKVLGFRFKGFDSENTVLAIRVSYSRYIQNYNSPGVF